MYQSKEQEFDNILGGAPKEVVQEFSKPGELSEEDLMGVMSGPNRAAVVDKELQNEEVFRQKSVAREKAAMFQELEQAQTMDSHPHTK